jgi:hypothetical protein
MPFLFFFIDCWHPAGYLLDTYGHRAVYDSGIPLESRLSTIIKYGDWFWLYARSNNIVDIQSRIPEIALGGSDLPVWNSNSGTYSCVAAWEKLRVKACCILVENCIYGFPSLYLGAHSFFLWLVFHDAIVIKEIIMCHWGYAASQHNPIYIYIVNELKNGWTLRTKLWPIVLRFT